MLEKRGGKEGKSSPSYRNWPPLLLSPRITNKDGRNLT